MSIVREFKNKVKEFEKLRKDIRSGSISAGAGLTILVTKGARSNGVEYAVEIPIEDIDFMADILMEAKKKEVKRYFALANSEVEEGKKIMKETRDVIDYIAGCETKGE
jgi:pilus assembly protein TadC